MIRFNQVYRKYNSEIRATCHFIFISSTESRLRAGWRLLIQALVQAVLATAAGLLIVLPYSFLIGMPNQDSLQFLILSEIIGIVTITSSVLFARHFLDKRSFASLGFSFNRITVIDLFSGISIAFIAVSTIYFVELSLGWVTVSGLAGAVGPRQNVISQGFLFLGVFMLVSWNQELICRGYHLQTVASGSNLTCGLMISSAIFSAIHLDNPNTTWMSVGGIFCAGLLFGYAYIRTKQLWLPISLHFGWNFFEGVVFGFPVSGLETFHLLQIRVSGPEVWTGGAFGPEAGLIVLPALVLASGLIYLFTHSRSGEQKR